jgi:DNA-binding transcriptional ArsR family regulator
MVTNRRKRSDTVFRAIADPTRREILSLLRTGERSVGDIASNFRCSRPAISKHLRLLRSAGLVTSHRRGTSSLCGLNAKPLKTVGDWLLDYQVFWSESLRQLKSYVEEKQ